MSSTRIPESGNVAVSAAPAAPAAGVAKHLRCVTLLCRDPAAERKVLLKAELYLEHSILYRFE